MSCRLNAQVVHPSELSGAQADTWRASAGCHPAFANPLLGPDFAQAVGRVRDDARVAVFSWDGNPAAFLPFHLRPGAVARPIGAPLSDYHALVSGPQFAGRGAELLAAAGLGAFRFSGLIDPHSLFGAPSGERETYEVAPAGEAEAYLEILRAGSAKKFKNWRRLGHKLEREVGPLRLAAPDASREAFDTLLAWKRDQLYRSGAHDFLNPAWIRGLFEDLFARKAGHFGGLTMGLYAGDRLVAGHFGVRLGGVYHPWIASADPELAAYSPGQIFLIQAIAGMREAGLTRYVLGPGHDHYKRAFAPEPAVIGEGVAIAPNAAGRAAQRTEQVWRMTGADRPGLAGRLRRRLEMIAAAETTLTGRALGFADALAGQARRRLNPMEAD